MRTLCPLLEALEARIAPASITVSYADLDGDLVRIKATNGLMAPPPLDATDLTFLGGGGTSGQLAVLHLTDPGFEGASIVFTVVKKAAGDGFADVGRIDATGVNLGVVTIKGDLGVIDAGSGVGEALKSLQVRSMGLHGTALAGGGDLESDIAGGIGSVVVGTDVKEAFIKVFGGTFAGVGPLTIRGSLIGGATANSGLISAMGDLGPVTIGGDILGGSGDNAGSIAVAGSIATIAIHGSLIGGAGGYYNSFTGGIFHEGQIYASGVIGPIKVSDDVLGRDGFAGGEIRSNTFLTSVAIGGSLTGGLGTAGAHLASEGNMGMVKIGGDIVGGGNFFTGAIESFGTLGNLTVGGSLMGGSASVSGVISIHGDTGVIKIGGDLIGGSISGTAASLSSSGAISTSGRIAGITIGRSILAGIDASSSGTLTSSGSISAGNDIGFITVKGSLIGNVTANGASSVVLSAGGQAIPSATSDVAIGKITIGGRVERALILAGYSSTTPLNGNAQIGSSSPSVAIGGASSLVAGIQDFGADGFGKPAAISCIRRPPWMGFFRGLPV